MKLENLLLTMEEAVDNMAHNPDYSPEGEHEPEGEHDRPASSVGRARDS